MNLDSVDMNSWKIFGFASDQEINICYVSKIGYEKFIVDEITQ